MPNLNALDDLLMPDEAQSVIAEHVQRLGAFGRAISSIDGDVHQQTAA
ncbi:MAG: hypothetical protein U1D55_09740 [Phycisphaerae bacterium]